MDTPCIVFAAVVVDLQGIMQWRVLFIRKYAMNTQRKILANVKKAMKSLVGTTFDVLTISRPQSADEAANLSKIVSKLSPLIGNLIEFKVAEYLNKCETTKNYGLWKRQDPGFPDIILQGDIKPAPGIEIKAWFPLATEITGRFKDSQNRFANDEVDLAILAWVPEYIFWGKPKIVDVCIVSGRSVAEARDKHYHKPPHYIVLEPEDTTTRTSNLQQTNTNGYVIQDNNPQDIDRAIEIVNSWGEDGLVYKTNKTYQAKLKQLQASVKYRLDTNYAKIDRIEHAEIESFKTQISKRKLWARSLKDWSELLKDIPQNILNEMLEA